VCVCVWERERERELVNLPPPISFSFLWSPKEFSETRPLDKKALTALLSSAYEGGRWKFVVSGLTCNGLASFKEFVCTGERGCKSGEETFKADGGGVEIGKLEGVLPAAVFFSICNKSNVCRQLDLWHFHTQWHGWGIAYLS